MLFRSSTAIPLVCQSDPGGENNTIANIHTLAQHKLDPSLVGTLQHRWKHNKTNVKSEAVRGHLGEDLKMRIKPVISSLLKGYLYIQSRHNYL